MEPSSVPATAPQSDIYEKIVGGTLHPSLDLFLRHFDRTLVSGGQAPTRLPDRAGFEWAGRLNFPTLTVFDHKVEKTMPTLAKIDKWSNDKGSFWRSDEDFVLIGFAAESKRISLTVYNTREAYLSDVQNIDAMVTDHAAKKTRPHVVAVGASKSGRFAAGTTNKANKPKASRVGAFPHKVGA